MRKRCRFFGLVVIAAVLLVATTPTLVAAPVKVVLLGGQSNMDGRAPTSGLPAALQSPQDDVLFYYRGNASLTTLRPGSGANFGPEVTFGRSVADAFPAEDFALIKHAAGGTSLTSDWDPVTGGTYSAFRSTVSNGLAALTSAGHTYDIVGMLWTQGERDAKTGRTTAQYEADLNEFIADVRVRYGADLPFYLSRLSNGQTNIPAAGLAEIRAAQENVAATDPFAWMIDTDGMGLKGDNLHFDAAGQIALGEAFADSFSDNFFSCNPGDTDGDGDVDTLDLTTAIQNFTGAGGSGKLCSDGDTDGDGDVDTVDLTTAIQNFTGALLTEPSLIYESATGNVIINTGDRDVITFSLQGGPFGSADFSDLPAGLIDNIPTDVGWASYDFFSGYTGSANLGAILPSGLSLSQVQGFFSSATYGLALGAGGGGGAFEIVINPEPASLAIMVLGATALVRRRRAA